MSAERLDGNLTLPQGTQPLMKLQSNSLPTAVSFNVIWAHSNQCSFPLNSNRRSTELAIPWSTFWFPFFPLLAVIEDEQCRQDTKKVKENGKMIYVLATFASEERGIMQTVRWAEGEGEWGIVGGTFSRGAAYWIFNLITRAILKIRA